MELQWLQRRSWITGGVVALVAGTVTAMVFTVADWRVNPGGIFHGDHGTHWGVVLQTALSWFLPVAVVAFVVVTAIHHLLTRTRRS